MTFIEIVLWMLVLIGFVLFQIIKLMAEVVKSSYSKISGALRKLVT